MRQYQAGIPVIKLHTSLSQTLFWPVKLWTYKTLMCTFFYCSTALINCITSMADRWHCHFDYNWLIWWCFYIIWQNLIINELKTNWILNDFIKCWSLHLLWSVFFLRWSSYSIQFQFIDHFYSHCYIFTFFSNAYWEEVKGVGCSQESTDRWN